MVMVRSKEDLLKALKICQSATCDDCPYADIGCSPPLAYDALELIESQELLIIDLKKTCQTLNDKVNHLLDNLTAVLNERAIRCKDCKYRPTAPEGITEGHHVVFPYDFDNPCPFQCGDAWYNEKPDDDFFCAYGTKMEEVK